MERDQVAALLAGAQGYLSGEEMSRALGVTRAAVWKEIESLRGAGWPIESSTRKGYRLAGPPPALSAPYISARLGPGSLFAGKITVEPLVDSTNTRLKALAHAAPTGTALLAEEQSGGRGTHGRSFHSPRGDGLYLSVLIRPRVELADLLTLTGWVAVAAREGVERASGAPVDIKWLNDLYLNGRKLCGILTEFALLAESGEPDYVVTGMGINHLAVCLLEALDKLVRDFPEKRGDYLERYRAHCITLGRRVSFDGEGTVQTGTAAGVDGQFALAVDGDDGKGGRPAPGKAGPRPDSKFFRPVNKNGRFADIFHRVI